MPEELRFDCAPEELPAFVEALRARGYEVLALDGAPRKEQSLVLGCFLSPRAYSGRIEYDAKQKRAIRAAFGRFQRKIIVSFGSPFVFDAFRGVQGLCAFSRAEAAQRAAARALAGELEVKGRMPVALRTAA